MKREIDNFRVYEKAIDKAGRDKLIEVRAAANGGYNAMIRANLPPRPYTPAEQRLQDHTQA